MKIRAYTPADFSTVEAWANARVVEIAPVFLSPNGFLVEDEQGPLAVCWVYLVFDCPIVIIDHLVTRPGTSLKDGLAAWRILWRTIQAFLSNLRDCNDKPLRYKVVRIFTRTPLARFLKADGWHVSNHTSLQAIYAIP